VSAIPEGLEPRSFWVGDVWPDVGMGVTVEWRGPDSWGVYFRGFCATRKGKLAPEPLPSSRSDYYLKTHRFPLEEATQIAQKVLKAERKTAEEFMKRRGWVATGERDG
jgi:hypothetical protein